MRKIITHFKVVLTLLLPVTVSAQQIQWQSCMASQFNHWFGEEKPSPDLLCGYLSVPLKYTDTGGDASYEKKSQVKLALTKLPAKSKHKGSILIISGGPGLPWLALYLWYPSKILEYFGFRYLVSGGVYQQLGWHQLFALIFVE